MLDAADEFSTRVVAALQYSAEWEADIFGRDDDEVLIDHTGQWKDEIKELVGIRRAHA